MYSKKKLLKPSKLLKQASENEAADIVSSENNSEPKLNPKQANDRTQVRNPNSNNPNHPSYKKDIQTEVSYFDNWPPFKLDNSASDALETCAKS